MKNESIKCLDLKSGKFVLLNQESLLFRPSVYGIVTKNKSILLVPARHGYTLPGGAVELGEGLRKALQREILEETGLKVKVGNLLDATEDYYISAYNKKAYHAIILIYVCKLPKGEISTAQFSEYEQRYYKKAEWVPIDKVRKIKSAYPHGIVDLLKEAGV